MDKDQLEQFGEAVERKKEASRAASEEAGEQQAKGSKVDGGEQAGRVEAGRTQDEGGVRTKNSGKGKKTADKWNQ